MSETTPDPADFHTGTDRVELTICIPGQCCQGYCVDDTLHDLTKDQADRVRDVVAARVQEYAAERDQWKFRAEIRSDLAPMMAEERDAARAELAAANARCAELEAMDAEWQRRVATLNSHGERAELISERNRATRERDEARSEAQRQEAQKTELQATLDRVAALADEWEASAARTQTEIDTWATDYEKPLFAEHRDALLRRVADLRAALTPEGTE